MKVRDDNSVHVTDVQFDDESVEVITLNSGAGCNEWPKGGRAGRNSLLRPKKAGVGMMAGYGTPIEYHNQLSVP